MFRGLANFNTVLAPEFAIVTTFIIIISIAVVVHLYINPESALFKTIKYG